MQKPDSNLAGSDDPIAVIIRGPDSGPLAGAPTASSMMAVGFAIAFAVPFVAGIVVRILAVAATDYGAAIALIVSASAAAEVAALLSVVRFGEGRLLGSVGIRAPRRSGLKLGLGFGLGLFVLVLLIPSIAAMTPSETVVPIGSYLRILFPGHMIPAAGVPLIAAIPMMAIVAIAEELAMRGFAASRLRTLTGSAAIGGAAALALDLVAHLPLWGLRYTVAIAPVEAILVGLFLWKRRLLPCIVANFAAGLMVLILVALAGTRAASFRVGDSRTARSYAAPRSTLRERAIDKLRRAFESHANPASAYVARAYEDATKGDYRRAIAEMDKAVKVDPYDAYLYSYRGQFYAAENLHDPAIANFTKAISLRPKADDFYRYRATEYLHKRDNHSADLDYSKAIDLNPKNPENFLERAILYQSENRNSEALSDIDKAIQLSPNDAIYHMRRAGIRLQMHDYKRALSDCDLIVKLYPSSGFGYGCRYDVFSASGDDARALASLRDLLKVDPGNVEVLADKGDLELKLGQWGAAKDDFVAMAKDALKVDAGDANWAAIRMATSTHPEGRDGNAALILARHACDATGYRNAQYIATLAAAYAELGEFARAIKWQKTAIRLEAGDPQSRGYDLAVLHLYEKGKPLRDNLGPATRRHYVLKAIAGFIVLVLMLIGLGAIIAWGVRFAARRRRSRAATA